MVSTSSESTSSEVTQANESVPVAYYWEQDMGGYAYRESDSAHISLVWWAEIDGDACYVDAANEVWGLAFGINAAGEASAMLIGPSFEPRRLQLRYGDRWWGVELPAHVFVRGRSKAQLLGEMHPLETDGRWFEFGGVRLAVPERGKLEDIVHTMIREGVLGVDDGVAAALAGQSVACSRRSLHRHTVHAAGMGMKKIEQLRRVRAAYSLLLNGMDLASAAYEAGFADQAHMTREFTRLAGSSPTRILAASAPPFASRP